MVFMHPAFLLLSFLGAAGYTVWQRGKKGGKLVLFSLPVMVGLALLNPLLNHEGLTVLFFLWDWAVTLEAVVFGGCAALMFVTVVLWFSCFHQALTSDRLLYLMSPYLPATAMVLTMAIGMTPRLARKLKQVIIGRKGLHLRTVNALSILTTWAFEDGLVTADSMVARGYGGKRSRYPKERFVLRDGLVLVTIGLGAAGWMICGALGLARIQFFPDIVMSCPPGWLLCGYGLLCWWPVLWNGYEEARWRYLRQKS